MARYAVKTYDRSSAADSNDNNHMAGSGHWPGNSTPVLKGHTLSESPQVTQRGMPRHSTELVSCWERSSTESPDRDSESGGQQHVRSIIRRSSRFNGYLKTSNRAQKKIRS